MPSRATFTADQVKRAVAGAIKGGMKVQAVEVLPDGTIRILPESPRPTPQSDVDKWFAGQE